KAKIGALGDKIFEHPSSPQVVDNTWFPPDQMFPVTNAKSACRAIDVIVEQAAAITSPLSAIPIFTLGGAVARVDENATAFTGRSAAHDINFVASWLPDDPEPERHKAWARAAWEAMRPFAHGVYVNFMSDEPVSHVQIAYGDRKYARLAALKSKYDPSNVFRFNQNIAPAH
ncbi:MAG TPA: BBE domain-containing protein, partial [Ilumatobacter sp.]